MNQTGAHLPEAAGCAARAAVSGARTVAPAVDAGYATAAMVVAAATKARVRSRIKTSPQKTGDSGTSSSFATRQSPHASAPYSRGTLDNSPVAQSRPRNPTE